MLMSSAMLVPSLYLVEQMFHGQERAVDSQTGSLTTIYAIL